MELFNKKWIKELKVKIEKEMGSISEEDMKIVLDDAAEEIKENIKKGFSEHNFKKEQEADS